MRMAAAALGLFLIACTPQSQGNPARSPTPSAEIPAAATPPRLVGASMAYDAARNEVTVFGTWYASTEFSTGTVLPATPTAETWTWRDGTWRKLVPANSPPPRTWAGMAYDEARREIVLFGGGGRGQP